MDDPRSRRDLTADAAARAPRFRSVLIICAANTARSVIAEHLLRRELKDRRASGTVSVRSAGIAPYARDGALISLDTRLTLREEERIGFLAYRARDGFLQTGSKMTALPIAERHNDEALALQSRSRPRLQQ